MNRPSKAPEDLITVKEFFSLVPDGTKADLLNGVIYMASPDSRRSNNLTWFIGFLLGAYDEIRDIGGQVFISRFAFKLTKYRAPEPDVGYVRPNRVHLLEEMGMKGGPDIAVEIVSRDSRSRDYRLKKNAYRKAGVTEYWIVDPLKNRVEFHRLREGKYEQVPLEAGHLFRSEVLPGFWLDVNWLLAKPLPKAYECLLQILR
ncbi:MAG: Uma2 family endonuclease [Planctomycetes bacterium]|nr:Uma2 family endonuclease [Planctomycetota bacterium]